MLFITRLAYAKQLIANELKFDIVRTYPVQFLRTIDVSLAVEPYAVSDSP